MNNNSFNTILDELIQSTFNNSTQSTKYKNTFRPRTNIYETEHSFEMELLVPGIEKYKIHITVEDNNLTIAYEHNDELTNDRKYSRKEFIQKSFNRSFSLGESIDTENIKATFNHGILALSLAKKAKETPTKKTIAIQ